MRQREIPTVGRTTLKVRLAVPAVDRLAGETGDTLGRSLLYRLVLSTKAELVSSGAAMSSLSRIELALVAFVVAVVVDLSQTGPRHELLAAGLPAWACDAIALAPAWPSTDDDRLDVIAFVAARMAGDGVPISDAEIERLRSVGLSDANLLDLAHAVTRCAANVG